MDPRVGMKNQSIRMTSKCTLEGKAQHREGLLSSAQHSAAGGVIPISIASQHWIKPIIHLKMGVETGKPPR